MCLTSLPWPHRLEAEGSSDNGRCVNSPPSVGIDQIRDLTTTLKRPPGRSAAAVRALGPADRERVRAAFGGDGAVPLFPFASLVAGARRRPEGGVLFEVFSRGFPLREDRLLVLEDRPADGGFGEPGRLWLGGARGLRAIERATLDAEAHAQLDRIVGRLRRAAVQVAEHRGPAGVDHKAVERRQGIERAMRRQEPLDRDAAQVLAEPAERFEPDAEAPASRYADVLSAVRGVDPSAAALAATAAPAATR